MIFNSILLLATENRKGVFQFLQELFYENDYELSPDEKAFLYNALIEYGKDEKKNYKLFIDRFSKKTEMCNILMQLCPNNKYGFFTNRQRVYIAGLDDKGLALTIAFLNIFGFGNVEN